jgi:curved DNA-binding protein CbpA
MNYSRACNILDINKDEISLEKIKKHYRLKALIYHPDKNKEVDAASKFLDVKSAYEYLLKAKNLNYESDDECDDDYEYETDSIDKSSYRWKMYSFLKSVLKNESKMAPFYNVLRKISLMCENRALMLIEKLDKSVLIKVFEIINTYKDAFHYNNEFISKIEEIIKNKQQNDECIILNPSLEDLFENNVYKLSVNEHNYIVPLWHHELIYDNSGNDIYVKCNPVLPDNLELDNKNNLHVTLKYDIAELWEKPKYEIKIANNKTVQFSPNELKLTNSQTLVFKDGISKINTINVYDVSVKALIYLHITINV